MNPADLGTRQAYYDDFSLAVGVADWRKPNWRHELLRIYVEDLLGRTRGLRILDVGCGAGVMSNFLRRYGKVTGIDLSRPAIELARALVPGTRFEASSLASFEAAEPFDLITLFDVVEHVPPAERSGLFESLRLLLARGGWVLITTPHPTFTRALQANEPELLQVVDEAVPVDEICAHAQNVGLQLVQYQTYDIDRPGIRQYQLFLFGPTSELAVPLVPASVPSRLVSRAVASAAARQPMVRLLPRALRLLSGGRFKAAAWMLGISRASPVQSDEAAAG
jgi:SAM-dependent methyltransferase